MYAPTQSELLSPLSCLQLLVPTLFQGIDTSPLRALPRPAQVELLCGTAWLFKPLKGRKIVFGFTGPYQAYLKVGAENV